MGAACRGQEPLATQLTQRNTKVMAECQLGAIQAHKNVYSVACVREAKISGGQFEPFNGVAADGQQVRKHSFFTMPEPQNIFKKNCTRS